MRNNMYKGKNIGMEYENMRYVYGLIVNEDKTEYKDEFICSYQIVRNYSIRNIPKKYIKLHNKLVFEEIKI